jgi:predicted membrane protein
MQNPEVLPMQEGQESTGFLIIKDATQELSSKQKDAITLSVEAEVKKQVAMDKNSLFTVFGLFASVVTFISVEVQILKSACSSFALA